MEAMNSSDRCSEHVRTEETDRAIKAAEFDWDLVLQLEALREQRGLSQAELAQKLGTRQQAISRLENPMYASHSLQMLRRVAEALNAYIDVVLVPQERLAQYARFHYRPVFEEEPECLRVQGTAVTAPMQETRAVYGTVEWQDFLVQERIRGVAHKAKRELTSGQVEMAEPPKPMASRVA